MICPVCDGKGKQTIPVHSVIDGKTEDSSFEMDCDLCKCTGEITAVRFIQYKQDQAATKAMWCQCGNPSGDTEFYDDNELCPGDKHHWDCKDCGKLLQIG